MLWTQSGGSQLWSWAGIPAHWQLGNTVPVSAAASAGATSVTLSGLAPSRPATVQGQYVQVGRRLYLAAADAASDGAGTATVLLQTPLLVAAAAGDPVRLVSAGCEMRLASQAWSASSSATDGYVTVSASFEETVEDYV